jgi:hypothetical protein
MPLWQIILFWFLFAIGVALLFGKFVKYGRD